MDEPVKKKRRKRKKIKRGKMYHLYSSDKLREKLLAKARVAVTNSMKYPEIKGELIKWGMADMEFKDGLKFYKAADLSVDVKDEKYDMLEALNGQFADKVKAAKALYINHLNLARVGIGDEHIKHRVALGLKGKRKTSLAGWQSQARQFYQNSLGSPEALELLRKVGLNKKKLKAGLETIEALDFAELERDDMKADAEKATTDRDKAFETLCLWLAAFYQVCRMVFHSGPDRQILERLGIPAITSPSRKKRCTKAKKTVEDEKPEEENPKDDLEEFLN